MFILCHHPQQGNFCLIDRTFNFQSTNLVSNFVAMSVMLTKHPFLFNHDYTGVVWLHGSCTDLGQSNSTIYKLYTRKSFISEIQYFLIYKMRRLDESISKVLFNFNVYDLFLKNINF